MATVEVPANSSHVSMVQNSDASDRTRFDKTLDQAQFNHSISALPKAEPMKLVNCSETNNVATCNISTNDMENQQVAKDDHDTTSWTSIHKCVKDSISEKASLKISKLLEEVSQLSDLEKLLLYIKLPTGLPEPADPLKINHYYPLGNRPHVIQAFTWIRTHLDEDSETSLPKHEVYDSYRIYCQLRDARPLSTADFGKAIKLVFPKVKPRRLGTRGNSRYCYSGLCKKKSVPSPTLPDVDEISNSNFLKAQSCQSELSTYLATPSEDLLAASTQLVIEWAEKLFSDNFDSLNKLAYYLVTNMLVDKRSVAAITLLSLFAKQDAETSDEVTALLKENGGNPHRDMQLQLQRKLHEKERLKDQKRKVDEHQSALLKTNLERSRFKKQTGPKTKEKLRNKLKMSQNDVRDDPVPKKVVQRSHSADDASTQHDENGASMAMRINHNSAATKFIYMPSVNVSSLPKCKPKYKPIQPNLSAINASSDDTHESDPLNRLKRPVTFDNSSIDKSKKAHIDSNSALEVAKNDFKSETADSSLNKTEQLSQLRWLLQQNLNSDSLKSNSASATPKHDTLPNVFPKKNDHSSLSNLLSKNNEPGDKQFQFTPITLRNATPAESLCSTTHSSLTGSPVPSNYSSQQATPNIFAPQSNESPFVSPRATPLSRSRHNSGQANHRTAPTHSVDNSNSSTFLSPHGTPVHVRSRHGSGAQASVRFNNRQGHPLTSVREMSVPSEHLYTRSRNMSGNCVGGVSMLPLSPHSKSAPMSPMYSQFSNSQPDLTQDTYVRLNPTLASLNPAVQSQVAQPQFQQGADPSQEVNSLLQNCSSETEMSNNMRCQSVPIYQMMNYLNQSVQNTDPTQDQMLLSKSYPATPNENQVFQFPTDSDQIGSFFPETAADFNVSYPATPATTPVRLPQFTESCSNTAYCGPDNQSNEMLYDPSVTNDLTNEDLQAALENLTNCSDLAQLDL